jgi:hypothetical protein
MPPARRQPHEPRTGRDHHPDPDGALTVHQRECIVVTPDFDFRALTYDERLALAEVRRTCVPQVHRHSGNDVMAVELYARLVAKRAGVAPPNSTPDPELDADG